MKKRKLCTCLALCACILTGCTDNNLNLEAESLEKHTLSIDEAGIIRSGIVESFKKDYYDKEELEQYLEDAISYYNNSHKKDAVSVDSFLIADKTAKVVFQYKSIEDYKEVNDVDAEYLTVEEAAKQGLFPGKFTSLKDGETVSRKTVEEDGDYHVLILNEEYDVRTSGKIYYYVNCTVYNNKSVHTSKDETSIIIFK